MKIQGRYREGWTLVELLVTTGIAVIVGALFFVVLRNISYLSAKNAAINLTHTQARSAIHRAVSEIRDSVSIPQLVDATGATLGISNGPAAGVAYQQIVAGPCVVWSSAAAGQKNIIVSSRAGDPPIVPGMRLIVPAYYIEDDITAVSAPSGTPATRTVTLSNNVPLAITCTAGSPNFAAYYTQRSALIVVGSDLRYYPAKAAATYSVISRNITTPLPFTVPGGDNRFIQAAFATQDPRILARNFKSMNLQMSLMIPYRFRLTTYQ